MGVGRKEGVEIVDEIGMTVEELANLGEKRKEREGYTFFYIRNAKFAVGLALKNGKKLFIGSIAAIFKTFLNTIDKLLNVSISQLHC